MIGILGRMMDVFLEQEIKLKKGVNYLNLRAVHTILHRYCSIVTSAAAYLRDKSIAAVNTAALIAQN